MAVIFLAYQFLAMARHPEPQQVREFHIAAINRIAGVHQSLVSRLVSLRERKVMLRVRLGIHLTYLREHIIGSDEVWTEFLDSGIFPFCRRSAYNYIDTAYLYQHGGSEYDFATLANMTTKQIVDRAHELRGTLHNHRLADQLQAERKANAHRIANIIISALNDAECVEIGRLISLGWDWSILENRLLDAVPRALAA